MTLGNVFWFVAGLFSATALLLLLLSWLRSQPFALSTLRRLPAWTLVLGLIAIAGPVALYSRLGNPPAANGTAPAAAPAAATTASPGSGGSMDVVVTALESRLRSKGGTDGDWDLLAQSYEFLNRGDAAALARQHRLPAASSSGSSADAIGTPPATVTEKRSAAALKLSSDAEAARQKRDTATASSLYAKLAAMQQMSAGDWANYADVAASQHGNSLVGDPERYLQNALRLDPRHTKALWLQGSLEHETGRYTAAVTTWRKLAAELEDTSPDAKLIDANIAEDERLAAGTGAVAATATPAARVSVRGEVTLDESLRKNVPAGLTLFILAKSVDSPGAPVAIISTLTAGWPVAFELDDSKAMLPERKLSTAGTVTIEARVSRSGQATPQSGDLIGSTPPLKPGDGKPVRIVIQKVVG